MFLETKHICFFLLEKRHIFTWNQNTFAYNQRIFL